MKSFLSQTVIGLLLLPAIRVHSQNHPFSVKDDIAMARFSDPVPDLRSPGANIAVPSPDGRHVAIVTTRGLLDQNRVESHISIFDLKEVASFLTDGTRPAPKPRIIASIVSYPHRIEPDAYAPVIKDLRWSSNGANVYFKGENISGAYQLYVAKLDGSGFRALTPATESVGRYDVVGQMTAYTASRRDRACPLDPNAINEDSRVATGSRIHEILFPGEARRAAPETFTMSVFQTIQGKKVTRHVPHYSLTEITYLSYFFPFALSPRGHQLIGLAPVPAVPDPWKHYEPANAGEHLRLVGGKDPRLTRDDNLLRPQQYTVIDLHTGKQTSLIDAPNARSLGYNLDNSRSAWAPDEHRVLITNTFLHFDGSSDDSTKYKPCAVASVDLPSLLVRCFFFEEIASQLASVHVQDVRFGADNKTALVLLRRGSSEQTLRTYQMNKGEWLLSSSMSFSTPSGTLAAADRQRESVKVFVRQSLNDPPTLWAADTKTGRERQLWNPNPQLKQVNFGEAAVFDWSDTTGRTWNGVLIKPVGYVSGKKYPLVIQMYSFVEGQFLTDGLYPTAFAARHLASAGFVVLQIKKKPDTLSDDDPQIHLEGYRSAIERLASVGLIDRTRVGAVGFSWTCWYVINALIKDPGLFSAATIADGLDNSYTQYVLFTVGSYPLQRQMERIRGSAPFGEGLKRWVDEAPGFHLNLVRTPLRIEAIGPSSILQEWELYSSLEMQKKPVDLIYFPEGTHIHQKPLERLASQQGNIDWLRFWLQGVEDPDPSKRSQYNRWEAIRDASTETGPK